MPLFAKWLQDNIGASSYPITSSVANANFMGFYVANTDATGGTARGMYMRLYLGGAGQSGEAVRAFTTVNAAGCVAVHGIQASVSFGTSGTVTGLAAGVRGTMQIPNATYSSGTAAAVVADVSADGSSTSFTGTALSFFRCHTSGNSTGITQLLGQAFLFDLSATNTGSGATYFIDNSATTTPTWLGKVKVKLPSGATAYLLLASSIS